LTEVPIAITIAEKKKGGFTFAECSMDKMEALLWEGATYQGAEKKTKEQRRSLS